MKKTRLNNGIVVWGLSPSKYVNADVKDIEQSMTERLDGIYVIPHKPANPFPVDYCPELDESEALEPSYSSYFQHLIGVMRWMVEIGRGDIATEVSLISSHLTFPRQGHLETAFI